MNSLCKGIGCTDKLFAFRTQSNGMDGLINAHGTNMVLKGIKMVIVVGIIIQCFYHGID